MNPEEWTQKNQEDAGKTDPEKEASNRPPNEDGNRIEDWSDSTLEDAGIGFGLGVLATLIVTGIVGLFKKQYQHNPNSPVPVRYGRVFFWKKIVNFFVSA